LVPHEKGVIPAKTTPTFAFRVDSSLIIGSGHLRRCLVFADRLRLSGARTIFICRDHPGNANRLVIDEGHQLIELREPDNVGNEDQSVTVELNYARWLGVPLVADVAETLAAITDDIVTVMVVDHYAINADWHRAVRPHVSKIVVIDDLADRDHDCDFLIDTATLNPARYKSLIPPETRLLLGPRYALLRPEFSKVEPDSRKDAGPISRVLIAFGGIDAENATSAALDAVVAALPDGVVVDVVLGSAAPHQKAIRARCGENPSCTLHVDTSDMATVMLKADLAIGAAGVISWERACVGLPSVVVVIADNQRLTADALAESGCALVVATGAPLAPKLAAALTLLADNPGVRRRMSAAGHALVDGRGAARVVATIMQPSMHVRPAASTDAEMLWHWRNDPAVRAVSLQSEPIALADHQQWLATQLVDDDAIILIGQVEAQSIGVVRYSIGDGVARVSIQLAPDVVGGGLGGALLAAGEARLVLNRPDVHTISADVLDDNAASLALFRAAGYRPYLHQLRRVLKNDAV
jgi:UDP-2,4-diacetamido-2,4,6-trideoxy-beta-L-altropyranose hydrolase